MMCARSRRERGCTLYNGDKIAACRAQPRATLSSAFMVVDRSLPPNASISYDVIACQGFQPPKKIFSLPPLRIHLPAPEPPPPPQTRTSPQAIRNRPPAATCSDASSLSPAPEQMQTKKYETSTKVIMHQALGSAT